MCLGTKPGRDLTVYKDEEKKNPEIIAEIFAVTDPTSNSKLKDEIISLANNKGGEKCDKNVSRYAFFILGKESFKKLKDKYKNWTEYTPKETNEKRIKIEGESEIDPQKTEACWKCCCDKNTINIVCWTSENCLEDWLQQKIN